MMIHHDRMDQSDECIDEIRLFRLCNIFSLFCSLLPAYSLLPPLPHFYLTPVTHTPRRSKDGQKKISQKAGRQEEGSIGKGIRLSLLQP